MDYGNTCALTCRFILLILLLYGVVLSILICSSCQFISAVTHNDETHGVGLTTFEDVQGACVPHNAFVVDNYNGMETTARVGGILAPTIAALTALCLLLECCRKGCPGGKCVPGLALLASTACQAVTFFLFQSDLFCSNKDIARCDLGSAAYRSVQACFVYAFSFALHYCGPTPGPIMTRPQPAAPKEDDEKGDKEKKGDKKEKKAEPGKDEDWTKEMYEARRKEKKVKGRGVSGRSKKEIMESRNGGSVSGSERSERGGRGGRQEREERYQDSVAENLRAFPRGRQPRFDDYVDTDPDGMDWSAYTPDQREAYYERQRAKKRERKREKEERRRRVREQRERDHHSGSERDHHSGSERDRHSGSERGRRDRDRGHDRNRDRNRDHRDRDRGRDRGGRIPASPRQEEYSMIDYNDSYRSGAAGYSDSYRTGAPHDESYRTGPGYDESYRTDARGYDKGDESYRTGASGYYADNSTNHHRSGQSSKEGVGYEITPYRGDRRGRGDSQGDSRGDSWGDRSGGRSGGRGDDYSYAQDSYAQDSYAQDSYAQDSYAQDSYYRDSYAQDSYAGDGHAYSRDPRSGDPPADDGRRGRSPRSPPGRGDSRGADSYDRSYYDDPSYVSYEDRRRDDPSYMA